MKNKYRIYFREVQYGYVEIEADNEMEAVVSAENGEGDLNPLPDSYTWEVDRVEELQEIENGNSQIL